MTQFYELIPILEKTVSTDQNELLAAQQYFESAANSSLDSFLKALSDVLVNTSNSPVARMAAGLQLKNHLTSKDAAIKQQYQHRWLQFPIEIRQYIKMNILQTIGTENTRPSSAAQCVAYVAVVELPLGQWVDLIQILVNKVISPGSTEIDREASLEAIGYICQDINSDVLETESNSILTAIIHGMRKQEESNHVRLAATTALLNSLEFTRTNFDKLAERNYIMEVVCETTQSSDTQICVAALQCLVKIMSLYYQYMQPYIGQALFPIALNAMKSESDEIALQGIEFWSNVSDVEIDLALECQEAQEGGRVPTTVSQHYARGALPYIVDELLRQLTKQDECDDDDNWNPTKAASVCLMLLATCCENEIVPHVLPFIMKHINDPNWRYREAAVMVFGSILNGLDTETSKPLVEQAMPTLIELMYDENVNVRDTTAWTFGRIGELIPEAAINERYLKPLLESLMRCLKAEPRVAANVCWAFTNLSEAAYEIVSIDGETPETYCLSPYFQFIVKELLETTDRVDAAQHNLRGAAYEALMDMIKNSPTDCYAVVQNTTVEILRRLNQILQMDASVVNPSDRSQMNDLQSLLCATLQSVLRKVTEHDAPIISDQIMTALLTMFDSNSGKAGGVQEDGLMAVSTLVDLLGENFLKYMNAFKPYLYMGLRNHQEYQVCTVAVGLAGDICRNLKAKILPFCDEIMTLLLETISNENLHRSVKPQILSVFGDMAISIGGEFKKYLPLVIQMLSLASQVQVDRSDYENVDYLNELRDSVLEAYTGIVQGLKGPCDKPQDDVQLIAPHVPYIIEFISTIGVDEEVSNSNISASAGLIGDLCTAFGVQVLPYLNDNENIMKLLDEGRKCKVARTKQLSNWAAKQIRMLREQKTSAPEITSW